MFRLILFAVSALLIAIATIVCYPLYRIIRKCDQKKGDWFALHFVQRGFAMFIWFCGVKVTYKGLENLPEDGDAVLFASNHRSLFDAILTYRAFKGLTGNLSKKELKSYPIIGWWIRSIYGVLLDRKDRRQGMECVLECIRLINSGISILAYPEGTRSHVEGELLMFHKGTFKIATKPGVRIVPVAVSGTGDIFDDHRPYIKARKAIVEFLPPVNTAGLSQDELNEIHNIVRDRIQECLNINTPEVM
ncbi:MAG: 1-acyl-sn-glycerol-3-phosphate acyltransferase [Parasporobacterium sp.]|nr:1-acyl-sn-glycerol-3-phosphate acyltransferase [Parasporobacterium sp.]